MPTVFPFKTSCETDSPSAVSLGGAAYVLWSKHPVDARVTCPGQPTRIIDDVSAPIRVQLDDGCYFKGAFGDSLDLAGLNNVTAKPTIFDGASDVIRALLSAPPYVADEALQLALASLHEDEVWGNGSVPLRPPGYRGPPVHTTWIDDIGAGTAYTIITVASVILLGLTGVAIFSIVKAVTLRTAKIQAAVAGTGFKQAGDAVPVPFPAETGYIARFKDAEDLAKGIAYVLNAPDMRSMARERALAAYSPDHVAKTYLELFQSTITSD